jgi:hypothetical protein
MLHLLLEDKYQKGNHHARIQTMESLKQLRSILELLRDRQFNRSAQPYRMYKSVMSNWSKTLILSISLISIQEIAMY